MTLPFRTFDRICQGFSVMPDLLNLGVCVWCVSVTYIPVGDYNGLVNFTHKERIHRHSEEGHMP